MSKKETGSKQSKRLERMKREAEAKRDKTAKEVRLKAKKAPARKPSHETSHEFH